MKYTKTLIIGGVTAIAVVLGASPFADRYQNRDGDRGARMIERVSSKLELTDEQTAALTAFGAELRETRDLMRGGEDGNMRLKLTNLISTDTFDQGAALTMITDRAAALQANAPELVAAAALFFDGLSAEQKATLQEFGNKAGKRGRFGRGLNY